MNKFKFKEMIVFFDILGVINVDGVPKGQTFNQTHYVPVLRTFHKIVRKRRLGY